MSMDWSNERYVRLYIRDTVTWRRWSWQARAVFGLLLRKVDRSGVLDTGRDDKADALALIIDVPLDVASMVLDEWVGSGTVELKETAIFLPHFREAQEAAQSDKMRQTESRARRALVTSQLPEDARHALSQPVTSGHAASQVVTPAVPSCAVPAVPSRTDPAVPVATAPKAAKPKKARAQGDLIAPPPATPPKPPTRIGKLHAAFIELRDLQFEAPPPHGLGLGKPPPDEAPDWGRSASALAGWLKRCPESFTELEQDQAIEACMTAWLTEPYWASPRDKEGKPTTPYPWGAFITEKQFAKAWAKAFGEDEAAA